MNSKIKFTYESKEYVLEYNRESIKIMESQNFSLEEYMKKPMTMIELAFQGAFIKNHRNITGAKVKEIFDNLNDKQGLNNKLVEMISECYSSLMDDEENADSKKINWEIV